MPDVFTKAKRSQVMAAIRSRGNKSTELKLASILRAASITGWRRHVQIRVAGCDPRGFKVRPDFVFRHERLAVFVDGCFWHGCRWHCRMPKENAAYWKQKIDRNCDRDREVRGRLRRSGWQVIRFWEHSLPCSEKIAARIISMLSADCGNFKNTSR